jgi:ornithine decarboxylase
MRNLSPRIASLQTRLAIAAAKLQTRHLDQTPCLTLNFDPMREDIRRWQAALADPELGDIKIYAAIKACPHPLVTKLVAAENCGLDAASFGEIELGLHNGHAASNIIFGNAVKKVRDIRAAYLVGVRTFALDRASEVDKLAAHAPGARVYIRLAVNNETDIVGAMGKYGCDEDMAVELMQACRDRGLVPYGLSFHVGAQMSNPKLYVEAIAMCGRVMTRLLKLDNPIRIKFLNIGGGFPAYGTNNDAELATPEEFGAAIREARRTFLPDHEGVEVGAEHGRSLFARSGSMFLDILGVTTMPTGEHQLVVNESAFGSFMEVMESGGRQAEIGIQFHDPYGPGPRVSTWISGQTCDSQDSVGLNVPLSPLLKVGDKLRVTGLGAYSFAYQTIGFNGFKPSRVRCINV